MDLRISTGGRRTDGSINMLVSKWLSRICESSRELAFDVEAGSGPRDDLISSGLVNCLVLTPAYIILQYNVSIAHGDR
jgi:hypothetical protein